MNSQNHFQRKLFRPTDLLWAALIAAAALLLLLLFSPSSAKPTASIYLEDRLLGTYSLEEDRVFSLEECPGITFEIRDGAIRFASSDCPDQTCVRTGFLSRSSQYAVCLPHRVSIRISDGGEPDAVIS